MNKFLLEELNIRRAIVDDDYEKFKSIIKKFDGYEIERLIFTQIEDILNTSDNKYITYMLYNCKWNNRNMDKIVDLSLQKLNSEENINIAINLILNKYVSPYNRNRLIKNINLEKFPECKESVQKMYDVMVPDAKYPITLSMYNYALKNDITINPLELSKNKNVKCNIFENYKGTELNWYYISEHKLNREFLIKYREFVIFEIFIIANKTPMDYLAIEEYKLAYARVEYYHKNKQVHCLLNELYCQSTGDNPITTKWGVSQNYISTNYKSMSKEDLEFILKYYKLSTDMKNKLQETLDSLGTSTDTPEESTEETPTETDTSTDTPEESTGETPTETDTSTGEITGDVSEESTGETPTETE